MLATVMLLLGAVGVAFVYFYLINIISEYWNCEDGATAGAVVHAVLIIIMGNIYRYLAQVCANIYPSLATSIGIGISRRHVPTCIANECNPLTNLLKL